MRKIVVEFVVPSEYEDEYSDVCSELVVEDFIGLPLRVISDTGGPTPLALDPPSATDSEDKTFLGYYPDGQPVVLIGGQVKHGS